MKWHTESGPVRVAHLTTVDMSLRYLLLPQMTAVLERGGEVYGISAPGEFVADIEAAGVRHIPLDGSTRGFNVRSDIRAMISLWRILRRLKPHILHTHNPKPGLYGRVIGRLAGVPVVINTVHGLYATPDDKWPKRLLVYLAEAFASRFSDAELVQNPEDHELLCRFRISAPKKTVLLGNGVDVDRFSPISEDKRRVTRRALQIPDGRIVVAVVGRLVREKGYLELFSALEAMETPPLCLVAGDRDLDKADSLTVSDIERGEAVGVCFVGHVDPFAVYAAADFFVLPSHREGYPRAAMEAAAMGLAVAATDIRGCRQVVDDGITGVLFPVRSIEGLARSLQQLSTDSVMRASFGKAGRVRAVEMFDEKQIVSTVLETQITALNRKTHTDFVA